MAGSLCGMRLLILLAFTVSAFAEAPPNLVADGIPAIPDELRTDVGRYLEFRAARFTGWHPLRREMLIATRFCSTSPRAR